MPAHHTRRQHRPVTSFDVAAEAHVSQATVSRAFTTPEAVSQPTRDRVYAAAERLGYAPNALARSLSSNTSRIIGVVVPANSEYYEHAMTLFARELTPHDYQVLLFEYDIGTDIEQVLRAVRSYRVDALVVSAMIIAPSQAASLHESGVPVVMFNYQSEDDSLPSVSVDGIDGMAQLARHLVATGHRSIVFAGGPRSSSADRLRFRGASEALAEAGLACRYVETGAFSYTSGFDAVEELLSSEPDAVMAASDSIAFGVIDGLRVRGVAVPDDVSVTGFDGLPQAAWRAYDLTTIEQPMEMLVRTTIGVALERAEGGDDDGGGAVIAGTLRHRSTVADRHVEENQDG